MSEKKIAFLFPGQGSQVVGMGKAFYDASPAAKALFHEVSALCPKGDAGRSLLDLMFEGPTEQLNRTLFTQPAILAVSLAALALFKERYSIQPSAVAGHSLGEFSALTAAKVLPLDQVVPLVEKRARLMEAAPAGAMAAVLGLSKETIESTLAEIKTAEAWAVIANDNCPGQIVISGTPAGIEAAIPALKAQKAKRVLPLPVGGAFHSPLMNEAAQQFRHAIEALRFDEATVPLVSNIDANARQGGEAIKSALSGQMTASVQWTPTMNTLIQDLSVEAAIEFGPGKVLAGLMKKTHPDVPVLSVYDMESLEATCETLAAWGVSANVPANSIG